MESVPPHGGEPAGGMRDYGGFRPVWRPCAIRVLDAYEGAYKGRPYMSIASR